MIDKKDLLQILNNISMKTVKESFVPVVKEYETSLFRQPELYGLPIFVIGYGGRPIAYAGQYISHKVIKVNVNGRIETKWRILTGYVRVLAQHRDSGMVIELIANGVPALGGIAEYMKDKENFVILEDKKEIGEIECWEKDIVNLNGVMNYEDPVILIDNTGLLRGLPSDVFSKYAELVTVYKTMQKQIYEMESLISDLKVEIENVKAENRILRTHLHRSSIRLQSISGALIHYKSELLRQKELMEFYKERLEAVLEGKENLKRVISDLYDFMETVSPLIADITEKIEQLEKLREEVEETTKQIEKSNVKRKEEGDHE